MAAYPFRIDNAVRKLDLLRTSSILKDVKTNLLACKLALEGIGEGTGHIEGQVAEIDISLDMIAAQSGQPQPSSSDDST